MHINDLEKVIPENIPDTGYLYNPIIQRKFGSVCELKFGGFKNLTVGQSITVAHIDERLKPAFTHTWKVNGGVNRYQIQVTYNGDVIVHAYSSISDQNNVNQTITYLTF